MRPLLSFPLVSTARLTCATGLRWTITVKIARQISVQHTPTLTFDGIIQGHVFDGATVNGIFSSWGAAEWDNWLRKNVE